MDADQRRCRVDIAHHQRHKPSVFFVRFAARLAFRRAPSKPRMRKDSPARGKIRFGYFFYAPNAMVLFYGAPEFVPGSPSDCKFTRPHF